jgi:hypothetical protein
MENRYLFATDFQYMRSPSAERAMPVVGRGRVSGVFFWRLGWVGFFVLTV